MGKSAIITDKQKDLLTGVVVGGLRLNPLEDINNNWVISEEEIDLYTSNKSKYPNEFEFLEGLKLEEHKPKYT